MPQGLSKSCNLTHTGVVPFAAISRAATNDELGLVLESELLHLVVIHTTSLLLQVVTDWLIDDAARVDERTVAEVTTVVEVQAHKGVARIQASQEDGCIGLSTRVRLHVGILCVEELADAVDGKLLHLVHNLTAAIIALARIALGIFVGQARAHGCHNLVTYIVL